jgi:PilZ domain
VKQAMPDPTPDQDQEARREERVTINKEFESYDAFINEYVTNISRTGVFVRSKTPLSVGTKVNLRFTVIMDDIETVEGIGEVVRVHDDPPGMGVVFTELSTYSKGLIDKLLTKAASDPKPPAPTEP